MAYKKTVCPCCGYAFSRGVLSKWDQAIELYYRSRGKGFKRKTLREIAEENDLNYGSLRKRKTTYDRAGKWGAKYKANPVKDKATP